MGGSGNPRRTQGGGISTSLTVERVPLSTLREDPGNVRQHPAKNLRAIEASLKRWGQQKPIVVDAEGFVVAGNGTLAAARNLRWETIGIVRTALKGTERTAYALADNRTAELAEWDEPGLAALLESLEKEGVPSSLLGWDAADLTALLDEVPIFSPTTAEEQSRLDQRSPITCPECGHQWAP